MTIPKPIRVLMVDDHAVVRTGLRTIIESQADMQVIAETGLGKQAVLLVREVRPAITIMDLRLPDLGGVEAIYEIRRDVPEAKILVLTTYEGDEDIHQALEAGAASYVIKGMPYEVLLRAIRGVYAGKPYLPPDVSRALKDRSSSQLSSREREVLLFMARGYSNRLIASELGITERTVKSHVGAILAHLNVTDRTQAVLTALKRGYVHL